MEADQREEMRNGEAGRRGSSRCCMAEAATAVATGGSSPRGTHEGRAQCPLICPNYRKLAFTHHPCSPKAFTFSHPRAPSHRPRGVRGLRGKPRGKSGEVA